MINNGTVIFYRKTNEKKRGRFHNKKTLLKPKNYSYTKAVNKP